MNSRLREISLLLGFAREKDFFSITIWIIEGHFGVQSSEPAV